MDRVQNAGEHARLRDWLPMCCSGASSCLSFAPGRIVPACRQQRHIETAAETTLQNNETQQQHIETAAETTLQNNETQRNTTVSTLIPLMTSSNVSASLRQRMSPVVLINSLTPSTLSFACNSGISLSKHVCKSNSAIALRYRNGVVQGLQNKQWPLRCTPISMAVSRSNPGLRWGLPAARAEQNSTHVSM